MKGFILVLMLISLGSYAQTTVNNVSSINGNTQVFPFSAGGIEFNSFKDRVVGYQPRGAELARVMRYHSAMVSSLSEFAELRRTLDALGLKVTKVDYQVTQDREVKAFLVDVIRDGQKVEGEVAIGILIPGEFDYRGALVEDSKLENPNSIASSLTNSLKESDQYRAITMVRETEVMLGNVGRSPALVQDIEVSNIPRLRQDIVDAPQTESLRSIQR